MSIPRDYTGSDDARANRAVKAEAVARWCLTTGTDPAVIVDGRQRRAIAREAGVRECSETTWAAAVAVYDRLRATPTV